MSREAPSLVAERAGKYLTFGLAGEEYGVEILRVREIIGVMDVTAVPRTPEFVKGVINLRGKVISVVDLRLKFGIDEAEHTEETCIIVVAVGGVETGVIVDRVSEVMDIDEADIDDPPSFGAAVDTDYIVGLGKVADSVKILVDIDRILSAEDSSGLAEVGVAAAEDTGGE